MASGKPVSVHLNVYTEFTDLLFVILFELEDRKSVV